MASKTTQQKYLEAGLGYARDGQRHNPRVSAVEALCLHAEQRLGVLKGSTIRLYRQRYQVTLTQLGAEAGLEAEEFEVCRRRIGAALDRLKGRPAMPRTASKKVKDAQDWMVKAVFGHLKLHAVNIGGSPSIWRRDYDHPTTCNRGMSCTIRCYWGAVTPRYPPLGVSNGMRQVDATAAQPQSDVPFAGFRPALTQLLQCPNLHWRRRSRCLDALEWTKLFSSRHISEARRGT